MRQAKRGTGPQSREHPLVQLGLGGVRDQQYDQVRTGDDVEHLAQSAVLLTKPGRPGRFERPRPGPQTDRHRDRSAQRVTQVLRLRRALRAPTDNTDPSYPGERPG